MPRPSKKSPEEKERRVSEETVQQMRARAGSGPWDAEPDELDWEHEGIPCAIRRGPMFTLCGYAQVPEGHWTSKRWPLEISGPRVHGGITYADFRTAADGTEHFWIGFDCNHSGDLSPLMTPPRTYRTETYRDFAYVKEETERLAEQIAARSRFPDCDPKIFDELVASYFEIGADEGMSILVYLTHTVEGACQAKKKPYKPPEVQSTKIVGAQLFAASLPGEPRDEPAP